MPTERMLVTVRTYPTPSRNYIETVCTGGITDGGEWRRLFPIPLRYLQGDQQFRTYDVIEANVALPTSDRRPESRTPDNLTLRVIDCLKGWNARCDWVNSGGQFRSIQEMRDAGRTIGMIRPASVDDLEIEDDTPDWTAEQVDKLRQNQLFVSENKPLEKIPRKFWLRWQDADGQTCRNRILSWEVHQTWRSWRSRYEDVDDRVRRKFIEDICADTSGFGLYIGNYAMHPQHFAVLGFFHPPKGTTDDTLWGN